MKTRYIYWIVGGLVGILLIVMLSTWRHAGPTPAAEAKAAELTQAYRAAGLPQYATAEQAADIFGEDGGEVCQIAGSETLQGYLKTRLGVGGEFYFRPTSPNPQTLKRMLVIVQTYCPDKLEPASRFVESLNLEPETSG